MVGANFIIILMSAIAIIFGAWCFYSEHHGEKNDDNQDVNQDAKKK